MGLSFSFPKGYNYDVSLLFIYVCLICNLDSETDEYTYNTLDDTEQDATKLVSTQPSSAHDPTDCQSQTTDTEIYEIKTDTDVDKAQYDINEEQNTDTIENNIVKFSTSTNGFEIQPGSESYEVVFRSADLSQDISDKYSILELKEHVDSKVDSIKKYISLEFQRLSAPLEDNSGLVQTSDHENNHYPIQLFSVHNRNPRAHIFKYNYRANFSSVLSPFDSGVFTWPSEPQGIPEMS